MPKIQSFYCTNCDFSDSDVSTWGTHSYRFGLETIPIDLTLGLCHECDQIVCVETLEKESYLDRNDDHQKMVREMLIEAREAKPRCLNCGGQEFNRIATSQTIRQSRNTATPIDVGLTHHNCGGKILLDDDTPNLFFGNKLPQKYYDSEGNRLPEMSES